EPLPACEMELATVQNFEQPFARRLIEHRAGGTEGFEPVPFDGIMARGDLQTSPGAQFLHENTAGRCRGNPSVEHAATGRQQPRGDGAGATPAPGRPHPRAATPTAPAQRTAAAVLPPTQNKTTPSTPNRVPGAAAKSTR